MLRDGVLSACTSVVNQLQKINKLAPSRRWFINKTHYSYYSGAGEYEHPGSCASWHQANGRYGAIYHNACREWAHKPEMGAVLSPACDFNKTAWQVYRKCAKRRPRLLQWQNTLTALTFQYDRRDWETVTRPHTTGDAEVSSTYSGHLYRNGAKWPVHTSHYAPFLNLYVYVESLFPV